MPAAIKGTMALPQQLTEEQLEQAKVISMPWTVMPPRLVTDNGQVFAKVAGGVHKRVIQNVGTVPIYYQIGGSTAPDYVGGAPHQILPGGTIAFDGTGGTLDVSDYPWEVWIWHPNQSIKALVFSAYLPNTRNIGQLY